jgi:hypothetical protein
MGEIRHGKLEQMGEHPAAEHGVDPVAGMQHEILPHPGEERREHDGQDHSDGHRYQRAFGLMHHDLVDHRLGEQRRGESHQLQGQGRGQHVPPDAPVLEDFRHEPAEAERFFA